VIADRIGDQDLIILKHGPTRAAAAYLPQIGGVLPAQRIAFTLDEQNPEAPFVDVQTHSHWGVEGRAIDGPMKGKTLHWLDSVQCKWFAWSAEYPGSEIIVGKR
jgi:hypothetical protein